jgi:hypothetical protein
MEGETLDLLPQPYTSGILPRSDISRLLPPCGPSFLFHLINKLALFRFSHKRDFLCLLFWIQFKVKVFIFTSTPPTTQTTRLFESSETPHCYQSAQ